MPIEKGILILVESYFSCFFTSKLAKIAKDKCSHCAMALDYSFRWLSTAPSQRIIALWVHYFILCDLKLHLKLVASHSEYTYFR